MITNKIIELKIEIDLIKEYLENEICKKCQDLYIRLKNCETLIDEYSRSDTKTSE